MPTSSKINLDDLKAFSFYHYYYINQLLGDRTLREVISGLFPRDLELVTEPGEGEFLGSYHHIVAQPKTRLNPNKASYKQLKSYLKKHSQDTSGKTEELRERVWATQFDNGDSVRACSVESGLQNLRVHPQDNLCQSYSVMQYLTGIPPGPKLTRELQEKIIKMWEKILTIPAIREQIVYSVTQKHGGEYIMENIENRDETVLEDIQEVLDEWRDYGWKYFLLRKNLDKD